MSDPRATTFVGYSPTSAGSSGLDEAVANAALILKAVNHHAELVEMLRDAIDRILDCNKARELLKRIDEERSDKNG